MTAPDHGPRDPELIEEAMAWFVRINAGTASDAERRAFEDWLHRDPTHPSAYAEAEALWHDLGEIPDPRKGSDPAAGPRKAAISRRRRVGWRSFGALAACLALAFAGLWISGTLDRLRADHATAVGERRSVTLSDGSVVQLNTDSALAVDLTETARRIALLRGEAFFTVAKDPKRTFEVVGRGLTSRALGTAFLVRRGGDAETVAVAEGRVRVSPSSAPTLPDRGVTLSAGEALRADGAGEITRQAADFATLAAWRDGKLVFADQPLRAVIAELDRYRPGIIVFLDSAVAEARFTGVLSLRDSDQALTAIERTLPVEAQRVTGYLTLLRSRE